MPQRRTHTLPIRRRADKYVVDYRKLPRQWWPPACAKSGQLAYPSKAQAEGAASSVWQDFTTGQLTGSELTPERRQLALEAFRRLEGYPDDALVDAADLYRQKEADKTGIEAHTFQQVVDDFLVSRAQVVAPNTLEDSYRPKYRKLCETFGACQFDGIKATELERWLADNVSMEGREGYATHLVMLWNFAVGRKYASMNAAKAIPRLSRQQRKKLKNRPPAIMNADELQRLLDVAATYLDGRLLPYFAVCALAGIRPEETRKIGWENVLWDDNQIQVPAEASKTGDDREVPMPDSLVEWLKLTPVFRRKGLFPWTREVFDTIRKKANVIERWQEPKGRDVLRHSCASHDYRLHGNIEATAAKMGHDVVVFRTHYKARVRTPQEAQAYFNVRPKTETEKTLKLTKAS